MKWVLVPEEPTEEMGDAGIAAWKAGRSSGTYVDDYYKAMIAAAPIPSHESEGMLIIPQPQPFRRSL